MEELFAQGGCTPGSRRFRKRSFEVGIPDPTRTAQVLRRSESERTNMIQAVRKRWAVVLAAGEGARLRELTTDATGVATPKQFCSLDGQHSLLGATLERARRIAPPERTLVIVARHHERWWRCELADLPQENVVVQPRNRGTALGIGLCLEFLFERDPDAEVVFLPSDHYVAQDRALTESIERAFEALNTRSEGAVLLGVSPDAPEREYGWIVPGAECGGGACEVASFVEKPDAPRAAELLAGGALWSSFLIVARARELSELILRRRPDVARALHGAAQLSEAELASAYEAAPEADLSRDVLQGAERQLRVLRVPNCGWTDLGTPWRVASCLEQLRRAALPARTVASRSAAPSLAAALERRTAQLVLDN
jgi:mannose-1-phosphate guanylyltransferase